MPIVNAVTRRDLLTLLLVVFVAAILRLGEPGIVEFKHDEAWLSRIAQDWLDGGSLPLTGMPSSVGVPNPPISVYLIALPFALTNDPLFVTLVIAALNVAGVALLWLLAHRYIGRTVALVAALAYAVNPWAVLYSRKIWAQDMHTPFVLAALLLGLYGFVEGRRWAQALCLPVFLFALQIHFAALALLPLYAVLLWVGRRRLWWAGVALGVALATLTLLPFTLGLSRTLADDPARVRNAISAASLTFSPDALTYITQLTTGLGMEHAVAPNAPDNLLASVPPPSQLWALFGGLALLGLAAVWTPRYRAVAPLLSLWALLPLFIFTPTWTEIHPHYFIASIPALALLTGVGFAWLAKRLPGQPISRTVLLSAFAVIALSQGIWWRGVLRYVDTHETAGFGVPLHRRLPIRDALAPFDDVIFLTRDARLDTSETPAVWTVLLRQPNRCVRALSDDRITLFPGADFAVVAAPDAPENLASSLYGVKTPSFVVNDYATFAVEPMNPPPMTQPVGARFGNGAQWLGYTIASDQVELLWYLPEARRDDDHYFIHLLDTDGERIAQYDAPFLAGRYGCAGDHVLTRAALAIPAQAVTLRVGMYALQGDRFVNADALDSAGNAIAPWADVPLER